MMILDDPDIVMHGGDFDFEDDDQDDCVENEEEEDGVAHPKNQADLGEDQLESPDVHIVDIFLYFACSHI